MLLRPGGLARCTHRGGAGPCAGPPRQRPRGGRGGPDRAGHAGLALCAVGPGAARCRRGAARRGVARLCRRSPGGQRCGCRRARSQPDRRSRRGGGETCSRICARSTPPASPASRWRRSRMRGWARPSATGSPAPPRRAEFPSIPIVSSSRTGRQAEPGSSRTLFIVRILPSTTRCAYGRDDIENRMTLRNNGNSAPLAPPNPLADTVWPRRRPVVNPPARLMRDNQDVRHSRHCL